MPFLRLDKLINLYDGYRKTLKIDSFEVLLVQEDGEVFVVQSRCPHREYPLERGVISNGVITCPWHNMAFDLKTGNHRGGVCDRLRIYEPVFQDNLVGIVVET